MISPEENPRPTSDFVFRRLFGIEENKDLLISLINSVVEPRLHVADVIIKNPFNLAEYEELQETVVDIKAMAQDGTWYTIEMQVYGQKSYGKRAIYYAAKGYVDQLGKGQQYSILNKTIGINFLAFDLFDDARMVRHFVFKDTETNEHPEDVTFLQLYFIEIGKFHKDWSEIGTSGDRWVAFMTQGAQLHRNNLPHVLLADPAIVKAVAELERIGADPKQRAIYEAEEKARMIGIAEIEYAEERAEKRGELRGELRGEQRGEERGIQRGRLDLLRRLMTRRIGEMPPRIEARLNSLTPDRLDDLGEALFDLTSYAEIEAWLSRQ
jgi:predicted transposase/invertase (TIGR01784 family)